MNRGQQAAIEERARFRFSRTVEASRLNRKQIAGYLKYGNVAGVDLALEGMFIADQAELDRQDAHEAWREAEADLAADQSAAAREAFS